MKRLPTLSKRLLWTLIIGMPRFLGMLITRKAYPSDVSDEEWALVAPYLTLLPEEAGQRAYALRAVLRQAAGRAEDPSAAIVDSRTLRSSPESGERAGYDGAKRKRGSKLHL